ncbi:MAG: 1,4-dihydroxy-2-naphthoate polyprenyltransferase [Chloroflexi bacterium]|nr:1,4-dihydroxy-2-naphthoate polyprenyltransferase [Chloroflexota bacterium]
MSDVAGIAADGGHPSMRRVWWQLARPFSLTASIIPVLVGTAVAVASGAFRAPDLFLAMLVSAVLIQIATNMFNEYYDYKRGLDTPETIGIAGAIVRGLVPPIVVFRGAVVCFAIALVLGLHIVSRTGPEVLIIGVASALAGFLYTGGPAPIAYGPLGELEVFVFMGPVIVGLSYFIHAGSISPAAVWASVPVACLVASILLANNLRDVAADRQVGRRTLPVVLGRRTGLVVFCLLFGVAYLSVVAAAATGILPQSAIISIATVRTPMRLVRQFLATEEPRQLHACVRGSAGLHARFGLLLATGIALGPVLGWHPPAV